MIITIMENHIVIELLIFPSPVARLEFLDTELGQLGVDFLRSACEVRINDLAAPPVAGITVLMMCTSGDENHWL